MSIPCEQNDWLHTARCEPIIVSLTQLLDCQIEIWTVAMSQPMFDVMSAGIGFSVSKSCLKECVVVYSKFRDFMYCWCRVDMEV